MRYILFFSLFFSSLYAQKVSILIPCHPAHFPLLEELLEAYERQTELPEEVVISLSQCHQIDPILIAALERKDRPFSLIVLKHKEKYAAGMNRKLAAKASSGEILMCQDADDLPHPQRVEIVKSLFEQHRLHLLIHSFIPDGGEFTPYAKEDISLIPLTPDILNEGIRTSATYCIPLHNGNVCVSKHATRIVSWGSEFMVGEDFRFNQKCLQMFRNKCQTTPLRLILFRTHLSYFSNTPEHLR